MSKRILVVDDNSPDGTSEYVENLSKDNDRVKILKREKSPVCLGHTQLSVSLPKLPTAEGGAPTSLTSLYTSFTNRKY